MNFSEYRGIEVVDETAKVALVEGKSSKHPTFAKAVQQVMADYMKGQHMIDPDSYFDNIASKKQPAKGKTNKYVVVLTDKKGNRTNKKLNVSIQNDNNKFTLTSSIK